MKTRLISLASKPMDENKVNFMGVSMVVSRNTGLVWVPMNALRIVIPGGLGTQVQYRPLPALLPVHMVKTLAPYLPAALVNLPATLGLHYS